MKIFLLIFKQGLKSIFQFKLQFIIILLLSFLSVFILTTSLTLNDRLDKSYNEITGKHKKFDYHIELNTALTENSFLEDSSSNEFFVPIFDYSNIDCYSTIKTNNDETSNINFIFNKEYYDNKQTPLTYIFEKNSDSANEFIYKTNEYVEKNISKDQYIIDLSLIFTKQIYKLVQNNFELFNNTTFGNYIKNKNIDLSEDLKSFNENEKNKINIIYEKLQHKEIFNYTIASFSTLSKFISNRFEEFNSFKNIKINENDKAEYFYLYITGDLYKENDNIKNNENVSKWFIKNGKYKTNVSLFDKDFKRNDNEFLSVNNENYVDSLKEKGLKGISSPLSISVKNNLVTSAKFDIDNNAFRMNEEKKTPISIMRKFHFFTNLELINTSKKFEDIRDEILSNWQSTDTLSIINSMFYNHLKYVSTASGFDIEFRKEIVTYDYITQNKYRITILDKELLNQITLLNKNYGGWMPKFGEILISEQYARKNNLKIGNKIKILNGIFTISGFATDKYSFYPFADRNFPIPQPKLGSIVYGSDKTIFNMLKPTIDSPIPSASHSYLDMFLTKNNNYKQNNTNMFKSLLFSDKNNIKEDIDYINNKSSYDQNNDSWIKLINFDDSIYKYNWNIYNYASTAYMIVAISTSIFLSITSFIALIICIQKTVTANAKKIGILKSLGVNSYILSSTYCCYPLAIFVISVLPGWFFGIFTQSLFVKLFLNYFSISLYSITIDFVSLWASFLNFVILGSIIAFIIAFILINRKIQDILVTNIKSSNNKVITKIKNKFFSKASFPIRFGISLLGSGLKSISLLCSIVGLSSLLVSLSLSIPSIALNAKKNFFETTNYQNKYNYLENSITNAPLTKPTINFWDGLENLESDWNSENPFQGDRNFEKFNGYYNNPKNYLASANDVQTISDFIYKDKDKKVHTTIIEAMKNKSKSEIIKENFQKIFFDAYGSNFYLNVGQQFNIGTIDQIFGVIFNTIYDICDPDFNSTVKMEKSDNLEFDVINSNLKWRDNYDLNKLKQNYVPIMNAISKIVPELIAVISNKNADTNINWKDAILNIIEQSLPPYVASYLNTSSRKEQFAISFNTDHVIPNKETLATKVNIHSNKYENIDLIGMQKNQNAFKIDDTNSQKVFFDNNTINKITNLFNNENITENIYFNNLKIYDKDTKTLNIPMLVNMQGQASFKLKTNSIINDIKVNSKLWSFKNKENKDKIIPISAWVYNDSDFVGSNYYSQMNEDWDIDDLKLNKQYLNLSDLDNNKFTYKTLYDESPNLNNKLKCKLKDDSYMFINTAKNTNKNELLGSYIRPYYQYKNIELYIPKNEIANLNDFLLLDLMNDGTKNPYGNWTRKTDWSLSNSERNGKFWFKNSVSSDKVPNSVKKAWNINDNSEFVMIKPYDLLFSSDSKETDEELQNKGFANFADIYIPWIEYATKMKNNANSLKPIDVIDSSQNLLSNNEIYNNSNINTINTVMVGEINSYLNDVLVIDQRLANLLLNSTNGKKIGIKQWMYSNKSKETINNVAKYDLNRIKQVYNKNEFMDNLSFVKENENILDESPLLWHNMKFSNITEPIALTSGVSNVKKINYGVYLIGTYLSDTFSDDEITVTNMIEKQELLSTTKDLIDQITLVATTIGIILIFAIIITAILIIMLIIDIYITKYQRFMVVMKTLGYSNISINAYTFGWVSILSFLTILIINAISFAIICYVIQYIFSLGLAIPYKLNFWVPITSILIIVVSYVLSLLISIGKISNGKPASLLSETTE